MPKLPKQNWQEFPGHRCTRLPKRQLRIPGLQTRPPHLRLQHYLKARYDMDLVVVIFFRCSFFTFHRLCWFKLLSSGCWESTSIPTTEKSLRSCVSRGTWGLRATDPKIVISLRRIHASVRIASPQSCCDIAYILKVISYSKFFFWKFWSIVQISYSSQEAFPSGGTGREICSPHPASGWCWAGYLGVFGDGGWCFFLK